MASLDTAIVAANILKTQFEGLDWFRCTGVSRDGGVAMFISDMTPDNREKIEEVTNLGINGVKVQAFIMPGATGLLPTIEEKILEGYPKDWRYREIPAMKPEIWSALFHGIEKDDFKLISKLEKPEIDGTGKPTRKTIQGVAVFNPQGWLRFEENAREIGKRIASR